MRRISVVVLISLAVVTLCLSPVFAEDYERVCNWDIPDAYMDEGWLEPGWANSAVALLDETRVVEDVNVTINVTHPRVSDLKITLLGPSGDPSYPVNVVLTNRSGGDGANYIGTVFDDEASQAIETGSAPFTGTFQPAESLTAFDGNSASAIWTLHVWDEVVGEVGTLDSWTLSITYAGGGPAPNVSLDPPSPDTLWPPNGKMNSVHISGSVEDAGGGVGDVWLSVNDEYDQYDVAAIPVTLAADGSFSVTIDLPAARMEDDLDGRCYEVSVSAQNEDGSDTSTASVTVTVPHNCR